MSAITAPRSLARHRRLNRLQMASYIADLEKENAGLKQQLAAVASERTALERQLDTAAVDLSGALHDKQIAVGETARAVAALTATESRLANATAISPLPQHVSTQPVPTVQQRFETGPAIRIGASPMASTNPGQPPATCARDIDDTQPLPKAVA